MPLRVLTTFFLCIHQSVPELEITDEEAEAWFSGQVGQYPEPDPAETGRPVGPAPGERSRRSTRSLVRTSEPGTLHLLLGDSVARRSKLKASDRDATVFRRARGGATWSSVLHKLPEDIAAWRSMAAAHGMDVGNVAIWLSGNDVYSRISGLPVKDPVRLADTVRTARKVFDQLRREVPGVRIDVLGPLPRLSGELLGVTWESTSAFHLERALYKQNFGDGVTVVKLGRGLTKKITHKRSGLCEGCLKWFRRDRTHLSTLGYRKLASKLPTWLRMSK